MLSLFCVIIIVVIIMIIIVIDTSTSSVIIVITDIVVMITVIVRFGRVQVNPEAFSCRRDRSRKKSGPRSGCRVYGTLNPKPLNPKPLNR